MDRISVVIPAYNCAQWLPRCIDSLLAQTYEDLEIIVVDDGSSDNTREVLEAYAGRIRGITQENQGVTAARLRGVREARGAWIGFVDADDRVEPGMFAGLLHNALEYGADISHCGFREIYSDGREYCPHASGRIRQQDRLTALRDLLEEAEIEPALCTKLYRRELFEGLTVDPEIRNNEDMLMNYQLFLRAEKAVYEDVSPYCYLIREGSASRRRPDERILYDPIRVRTRILETCPGELRDDAARALVRMCLVSYRAVALEDRKTYQEDEKRLRSRIRELRSELPILSPKNALQVRLIGSAPGLYRFLYRIFAALRR